MQAIEQGSISSFASSLQSMESGVSGTAGGITTEQPGYFFQLTAGTGSGATGYDSGVLVGPFGSIDAQPHPTSDLEAFWISAGGSGVVWFAGDITADLAGKTVKVDSIEYTFDDADWFFDSGYTQASWSTNGPPLSNMGVYAVEIT